MERREYRHRRRVRNQIIAYIVTAIIVIGLIVAAAFGIKHLMTVIEDKKHAEELQQQLEELSEMEVEAPVIEAPVAEPEVEEPVEEKSYLDEIVDACIAEMPLEDKVAGLFMITPEALTDTDLAIRAGDTTKEKLGEYSVGGLIYFSENMQSADQLTEMLQNTKGYSKYPIFLGVDEEGGEVSRVAESGLADNVGKASDIGAAGDPQQAKDAGAAAGSYLAGFGFNVNFAPVADVKVIEDSVIGDRSYGSDAGQVGAMVAAGVEGIQSTGVSACLKHFPGLGSTTEDTHAGMAGSERTVEEFTQTEFAAFQAGIDAGAEFVMVSHLSVPGITGDNTPSSLSSIVVNDVLRGQLGYNGIVITDAMDMGAITAYYTADQAAVMALQAGVDMILMPEDFETAYNGVLEAVNTGTLTEERIDESLRRIFRVKYKDKVEQ
ncbi:MAG: beta-N-acetylhexosaminidase [Lachnospiraceae bacterium]|nr:beta-N-acetylhexosaminidase [Lachnospiraceae bacterium]